MYRSVRVGYPRPALKREDDPVFWDEWQAKLAAMDAKTAARDPANWMRGQQIAILMIERSAIALDCIAHMTGSMRGASQEDFLFLREQGYAVRPLGQRYHQLTPAGIRTARDCADAVAKKLGLHHIRNAIRGSRSNGARCTCGWSCSADERYGLSGPKIDKAITRHLASPDEWKRGIVASQAIINAVGGGDKP